MLKFLLMASAFSLIGCSDYSLSKVVEKAPEIEVTPMEHDFGALNAEGESADITVSITNIGNKDLNLESIYLLNENPNFIIENSYPSILEPSESTDIIVFL